MKTVSRNFPNRHQDSRMDGNNTAAIIVGYLPSHFGIWIPCEILRFLLIQLDSMSINRSRLHNLCYIDTVNDKLTFECQTVRDSPGLDNQPPTLNVILHSDVADIIEPQISTQKSGETFFVYRLFRLLNATILFRIIIDQQ